jgi:BirA family biotin operon repressor/biotin-[acetyl-CoA-carboxylase] ligase
MTQAEYAMPLDKQLICSHLSSIARTFIHDIQIFNSVTSTNDILLKAIKSSPEKIIALFAETQTAGRGRQGRTWISPANTNIYFSLSWHFEKSVGALSGLSLVIAIAIVRALKDLGIREAIKIKWPNDLMFENKKLGGILIESNSINSKKSSLIIGIGLNVNLAEDPIAEINQPWTSLFKITHQLQDRNLLSALLLNKLSVILPEFEKNGLENFQAEWNTHDALLGKYCEIKMGSQYKSGISLGINALGELLLKTDKNIIEKINSGEIVDKQQQYPIEKSD